MMDKLAMGSTGAYPGMPRGNAAPGGLPTSVPPGGSPPGAGPMPGEPGPEGEGGGAPDLANIFLEWGYGKAAEAQAGGNQEAGDMISQGIDMVLQGIQIAGGGPGTAVGNEGPLPVDSMSPGRMKGMGVGALPTPTSAGRVPFGAGGGVPMQY